MQVVLVDLTQHLEVHITSNPSSLDTRIEDIFSRVHADVIGAITKVFEIMHLDTEHIKISSAVFCSCKEYSEQHLAVFEDHNDKKLLRCDLSIDSLYTPNREQLLWKGVSSRMPRSPGSSLADSPGLAILVTCDYTSGVTKLEPLPGTNKDAQEMRETLDYLGYVPHVLPNPTKAEIQEKLQEVSDTLESYEVPEEEKEKKVIMFVFSGHGCNQGTAEKIYANDGGILDLKDGVILPLTRHEGVFCIPKLFLIDACRGRETLSQLQGGANKSKAFPATVREEGSYFTKAVEHVAGNYRIDYATIPGHVSYAGNEGSMWLPKLARAMGEHDRSFQDIAAIVKQEVHEKLGEENRQQCQTDDRLNCGPLFLYKN